MRITVAICTWNRAELLAQTLEQMTRLRVPGGINWELLVVNNRCTDNTDAVLRQYAGRLPLRRCWEPELGLSHARNRAVAEATGDYLIWTDDDVLADEDWLEEYHRAFERWPEAAVFGGPIAPWFAGNPPSWLVQVFPRVAVAFAAIEPGDRPLRLESNGPLPFGANMAVRMREQRRHRFDPSLGVRGTNHGVGEETFLLQEVLRSGATGHWVPGARVRHYIPAQRQTVAYLRNYYAGHGQLLSRQGSGDSCSRWFGRPRWAWRQAVQAEVCFRVKRCFRPAGAWIDDLVLASKTWGILKSTPSPASGPMPIPLP